MAVTFFNNGLTVSDDAATRADAFCEAVMLSRYADANDGELPPNWPAPAARKILIEWTIKALIAGRVRAWERQVAQEAVSTDPWDGVTK